jgi:hypothetical protein
MKEALTNSTRGPAVFRKRKTPEPSEAQIRERAYKLYLERGGRGGQEREDWLEAERELRTIFAT